MRTLDAEVVLHHPHRGKAQLVGQLDLLDGFAIDALLFLLLAVGPGFGNFQFEQQVEFHGITPGMKGKSIASHSRKFVVYGYKS